MFKTVVTYHITAQLKIIYLLKYSYTGINSPPLTFYIPISMQFASDFLLLVDVVSLLAGTHPNPDSYAQTVQIIAAPTLCGFLVE